TIFSGALKSMLKNNTDAIVTFHWIKILAGDNVCFFRAVVDALDMLDALSGRQSGFKLDEVNSIRESKARVLNDAFDVLNECAVSVIHSDKHRITAVAAKAVEAGVVGPTINSDAIQVAATGSITARCSRAF